MKNFLKLLFLGFLFSPALSAAPLCDKLFHDAKDEAYFARNERIAQKYPQFKELLSDPQKYFKKFSQRFEEQKKLDPNFPYEFDMSEWGLPLFVDMRSMLEKKKEVLTNRLDLLGDGWIIRWVQRKQIASLKKGIEYYDRLLRDLDFFLKKGSVTYSDVFEMSYFCSRALGFFDIHYLNMLNLRDRLIVNLDEFTEGYEKMTIEEEFNYYLKNNITLFSKKSPISTWQLAAQPFTDALFSPNHLEVLILPTTASLDTDIFMHLMSSEIYLVGVSDQPLAADGYRRPSGLFLMHDYRHSSFMYYRNLLYRQKRGLTRDQIDQLSRLMSLYAEQLDQELHEMNDPNLAAAIRFYLFNQHHDGGYHYAPSNYETNNAYHAPFILYVQLVIANQRPEFTSIQDIARARQWVEKFWLARVEEENRMIQKFQKENAESSATTN
jgi:hypothetical protein